MGEPANMKTNHFVIFGKQSETSTKLDSICIV
jgi:hypothetical protein